MDHTDQKEPDLATYGSLIPIGWERNCHRNEVVKWLSELDTKDVVNKIHDANPRMAFTDNDYVSATIRYITENIPK